MSSRNDYTRALVREIRRITWVGLVVNVLLSGFKFALGVVGHSQALVADAVHSVSDVTTDLAILFGAPYWNAPADEDHPYGHGKFETIVTTFIALIMAAAAVGIGRHALHSHLSHDPAPPRFIALWGALGSIVAKEWLYRWTSARGRRLRSSALVANAWHHRTDAISSLPVLVAVLASAIDPRLAFLDHLGAALVSLFILWSAGKIVLGAFRELTDHGADERTKKRIHTKSLEIGGVLSAHAIRTRMLGQGLFVDLHIMVEPTMTVREGHDISEEVKRSLLSCIDDVVDVVVHLEPYEQPEAHVE